MSVLQVMAILVFCSAIVFGVLSCISAGFGMFMNWLKR